MNPQPEYTEVLTFTFGFILLVLYFFADSNNHYKFSDKFTIAEYEDYPEQQVVRSVQTVKSVQPPPVPKRKTKAKTQPKKKANMQAARKPSAAPPKPAVERNHNGYTPLQQDCFDALKSLGIKGVRERKYIVSKTFNEHDPKTIQEFLTITMSRSC
tara:strand:+ start:153 stop:620 length:468 start_codon:yes stop_codon:yes gene_type:complete